MKSTQGHLVILKIIVREKKLTSESTQIYAPKVFFFHYSLATSMTNGVQNCTGLLFYAYYVGIRPVRILVFDNYQKCPQWLERGIDQRFGPSVSSHHENEHSRHIGLNKLTNLWKYYQFWWSRFSESTRITRGVRVKILCIIRYGFIHSFHSFIILHHDIKTWNSISCFF